MILYLFDENMSQYIAQAMDKIEFALTGNRILSTTEIEELGRSATDSKIMEYAKNSDYQCVIVTNDRDFKKRTLLKEIMTSKNVGLFLLKFPKGSNFWRKYKFTVNHWEGISKRTKDSTFPFSYMVSFKNKFTKI